MSEWLRRVQSRRERRPGHGLFLDDMLKVCVCVGGGGVWGGVLMGVKE